MSFTAVSLAALVAEHANLTPEAQVRVHRVVRNLVDKDVLRTETDVTDGRAPRTFSTEEAAVALVLVPLSRMAVDVRTLRRIADRLRDQPPGGKAPITRALDGARAGSEVHLVIKSGEFGSDEIHVNTRVQGEHREPEVAAILEDYAAARGEPLVQWIVHATPLLLAFGD